MKKLKPCPFCGNEEGLEVLDQNELEGPDDPVKNPYFVVVCSIDKGGCGSSSGYFPKPEKAAEAWNRRAESTREGK